MHCSALLPPVYRDALHAVCATEASDGKMSSQLSSHWAPSRVLLLPRGFGEGEIDPKVSRSVAWAGQPILPGTNCTSVEVSVRAGLVSHVESGMTYLDHAFHSLWIKCGA